MSNRREQKLSTSSDRTTLGVTVGDTPTLQGLLDAQAAEAAWRLVDLWSQDGLPFEFTLNWSAGTSSGQAMRATSNAGTRVCLWARNVRVEVGNRCNAENTVGVAISDLDGPMQTSNTLEVTATTPPGSLFADYPVPRFADHVRVDLVGNYGACTVDFYDGQGLRILTDTANNQPNEGWPVMGATHIVRITPPPGVRYRVAFRLSI